MQKADVLIRTKLRLPYTRPGLVSRPRLQEQIRQGLRCPLTLVTAPAGFGKTTLVASSIAGCGMPVGWLSLDKNDNQAGRFLTYLIAALQSADNRIGSEAAQLMAGIQQALPEAVLTNLINDLDSTNTEIVLVLDDYQLISSQAVHEQVAFLLKHRPSSLHLVIATRSDPPLPLARLRARAQTVELRAADLRFTELEAAQFLNEVMGLHLDPGSIAALEERTEGWIAGLQMASLALQGARAMPNHKDVFQFIEGFSGTNRFILDYLLEEVLASQPPEIQHFLLRTSILERLTAPLCDALMESERAVPGGKEAHSGSPSLRQSASVLEYLERENLFLVSLDEDAGGTGAVWFRYHHLFADLLRVRLQQEQPNFVPALHIRASAWLEQNGTIAEAIQHLFAAHENDRAADLIERYGSTQWAKSDPTVVQMADSLPPEMLFARPIIGLHQAWLSIIQGHIRKALPLLNGMARHPAAASPISGQQWIQTIIELALAFLGQRAGPSGYPPLPDYQVLDEIPADQLILRDAADILYGMALARRGEIDRAAEVSVQCIQRDKTLDGTLGIPTLVPFLARIYLIQGRLSAAAALCREYLDPIKMRGNRLINSAGSMDIVLGEVLYERNCLEEAERLICAGLQANEPWQNIMTDAFGLTALTRVLQAKGDTDGAKQIVEKFETKLQGLSRPVEFDEDLHTLKVRLLLANKDLQNASLWADQIQLSEDFHLHRERYLLTLARIRLAQGSYANVEEILTVTPSPQGAGNRITRELESRLVLAAAVAAKPGLAGKHRLPEALETIESCLALAAPEGYIRIFLDVGEPVRELLAAYLQADAPDHKPYAQKVLDAFSTSNTAGSPGSQSAGLVEPLSGREVEVLHLMSLGRTNQEIAKQLIVARGTIKAHAASIYRKLDAANRTEAVARARQLGILP